MPQFLSTKCACRRRTHLEDYASLTNTFKELTHSTKTTSLIEAMSGMVPLNSRETIAAYIDAFRVVRKRRSVISNTVAQNDDGLPRPRSFVHR
jgi:hypothetical protein